MRHVAVIKTLYKDYNKALDSSLSTYERPITISRNINNGDSGFAVRVNDCLEKRGFTRLSVTRIGFAQSVNFTARTERTEVDTAELSVLDVHLRALLQTSLCVGESKKKERFSKTLVSLSG